MEAQEDAGLPNFWTHPIRNGIFFVLDFQIAQLEIYGNFVLFSFLSGLT